MLTTWIDALTPCLKDAKTGELSKLAGPYFKSDIPNIRIDYQWLTAFARGKGCKVCDLSDEEKNLFIKDADMNIVRKCAIKLSK